MRNNNVEIRFVLVLLFFLIVPSIVYKHHTNKVEKRIIEMSENIINYYFPAIEQLAFADLAVYTRDNQVSGNTIEIIRMLKQSNVTQKISGATLGSEIEIEFIDGLTNAQRLIAENSENDEMQSIFKTVKRNLETYEMALAKSQYFMDENTSDDFEQVFKDLATIYPRIEGKKMERQILYIMADCAERIKLFDYYMVSPVLLTKIISENPNDELARKSWVLLNQQMRDSFTGSSGEHTPLTWRNFINDLAILVAGY